MSEDEETPAQFSAGIFQESSFDSNRSTWINEGELIKECRIITDTGFPANRFYISSWVKQSQNSMEFIGIIRRH